MKHLIVLSGAGMSAESGLSTFRDGDGLWEKYDPYKVATPEAWDQNPNLVLEFYNLRRRQLHTVAPNAGHQALVALEAYYQVDIITQNVDNLHEQAGSSRVMHLHGELLKVRSTLDETKIYDWPGDLTRQDCSPEGHPLRPHIVWFGEPVPLIIRAAKLVEQANVVVVVGTSLQVYPAASLVHCAPHSAPIYLIDPRPNWTEPYTQNGARVHVMATTAAQGLPLLAEQLIQNWGAQ